MAVRGVIATEYPGGPYRGVVVMDRAEPNALGTRVIQAVQDLGFSVPSLAEQIVGGQTWCFDTWPESPWDPPDECFEGPWRSCDTFLDFHWGYLESGLYGAGKGPPAARQPKYVKQKTRFGEFIGLRARLCDRCGHVEIFAWPDEGQ